MKAIFNHFNSLGGLYNVSQENLLDTRIFNDEIKLIEEYLKRDIPKLLWNILKKYQGHGFNDEVGFNVTTNIPILGNSTFLEFGQFLSLCQEASLYLLDVIAAPFVNASFCTFVVGVYMLSLQMSVSRKLLYSLRC